MGLDMYARSTKVPIEDIKNEEDIGEEIAYWRKHPNLHGWMERLYIKKGGKEEFNCVPVELTLDDLEELENEIINDNLQKTDGFFFGKSYGDAEEKQRDLKFIIDAKLEIFDGRHVYYTSWW